MVGELVLDKTEVTTLSAIVYYFLIVLQRAAYVEHLVHTP